jgi:hypothetical protein
MARYRVIFTGGVGALDLTAEYFRVTDGILYFYDNPQQFVHCIKQWDQFEEIQMDHVEDQDVE